MHVTRSCPMTMVVCAAVALFVAVPAADAQFTDFLPDPGTLGSIPDFPFSGCSTASASRDVTFTVAGMPRVGAVRVTFAFSPAHTWGGDITAVLIAPDGTSHILFGRIGAIAPDGIGSSSDLQGPYTFADDTAGDFWTVVGNPRPAGSYRTSQPGGAPGGGTPTLMNPVFAGRDGNGTWVLRVSDHCNGDTGAVSSAILSLEPHPLTVSNLRVDAVTGNQVRLRWDAPPFAVTGYVIEGGVAPGAPLAAFNTGSTLPVATFAAPSGSFWVRVRVFDGPTLGPPSAEVPLHVGVPVPPTPPANVTSSVVGDTLDLSWRHTYGGGPPTSMVLGVSGSLVATIPLAPAEAVSFAGVPPGAYTLTLQAANAAGLSTIAGPFLVNVPAGCAGAPQTPANFLFYTAGGAVVLLWDPPAKGPAPTSYVLNVTGSFVGALSVTGRELSAAVPPGTYTVTVAAVNACGASAPTAPQSVTVL